MRSVRKKSILKTINRQKKMIKNKTKHHSQATFFEIIKKVVSNTSFNFVRKTTSKYTPVAKINSSFANNLVVLKSLGLIYEATKAKKTKLRLQKRNGLAEDGWTCKERRFILLLRRKLQNVTQ